MPLDFDIVTGLSTENSQVLKQDTAARLAKIYGENRPDLNTGTVTMPNVPNIIGDARLSPPEDRYDLAMKNWITKSHQLDQDFMSGSGNETLINGKGTDKYLGQQYGYNPARDNEDFYAQQQSIITEVPKALIKFVPLALAKVGTGIGYLAGLANPNNWDEGYIFNAADNAIARTFQGLENSIKDDWMPTFQEANDRNKGFFNRAFTDLNFWTQDTLDAAAFMASAFVPGIAVSKIGVGAKAATLLSRLGIAAENGVLGNIGFAKLAAYMKNAQQLATTLDKTLITALNTASEAMWEAKGVRDNVMGSLSGKINPATGRTYTELEKRDIAGTAAQNTFLANAALLSVSNLWETNLLFKSLNKEGKGISNIGQGAIGEAFEATGSASKIGKFFESKPGAAIKAFGEGLGVEGLYEENMQLAVQRVYDGTSKYSGVFGQLFGQTRDAIAGDDPEAAISIGLGGLIGGLAGGVGNIHEISKQGARTQVAMQQLDEAQAGWLSFGSLYKRNDDGSVKLGTDNKPILDVNKATAAVENWSKMTNLKVSMDATSSPELKSIIQKEAFARLVKAHINAGIEDQLPGKLGTLATMSDEDLVLLGQDPSSVTNRAEEVAGLQKYAHDLIELHKTIEDDILYKPSDRVGEHALRKNYLYTLGARQLALTGLSRKLDSEMATIKSRLDEAIGTSVEDNYVDDINYLKQRIMAQRSLISSLDSYDLDGVDTNIEDERKELASLTKEFNELRSSNKPLFDSLTVRDELYQYPSSERNRNILTQSYQNKQKLKASLDNSAKSVNTEFYNVADINGGAAYYRNKIKAELDRIEEAEDTENPPMTPEAGTTGTKRTYSMKGAEGAVDVELEEGKRYLGQLSKTVYGSKKGLQGTAFTNDNIRIIKLNDDGSVVLTVNNDAPVTFTQEELADVPALFKYENLSPLQRFYIENRNKVFKYRVPIKYNKSLKRWETDIVSGRLSYDKKNNVLNIAYKVGDSVKYVEFDPKYVQGAFDITSLPTDEQLAIKEQEQKLDAIRRAQYRLFESLINNTDVEIQQHKDRTVANQEAIAQTEQRLSKLSDDLAKYENEFALADITKIEDKRTKAARVLRIINKLKSEIGIVENQLASLRKEGEDILKRQQALEFMMNEYLVAYDSLLDTGEPVVRAELDYLEHRKSELESQDKGARYTIQQVEDMLEDTLIEQEINEEAIDRLEGYLADLQDHLKRFQLEYGIGQLFDRYPNITELRNFLKEEIAKPENDRALVDLYKRTLARVNKQPSFFYDVRFLRREIADTKQTIDRAIRGSVALQDRIDALVEGLSLKNEVGTIAARINALKTVFQGLAGEFEREKASKLYSEEQKGDKVKITAMTVEDAKAIQENAKLFSEFLTEPPTPEQMEGEIEYWSTDKPVMAITHNPLFKSADSHYPGDILNPQPYTQRFFKFTSTMNLADGYYLQPVTADNDVYGIRYTQDTDTYPDDIKFIVVAKTKDGYLPVDYTGAIMTSPLVTKENLVYSSFYGHRDLLSGGASAIQWVKDNMAPKNMSDADIQEKINEFLSFRDKVKEDVKRLGSIYYPITSKSNGVQNHVPFDTATGLPQQLPVEGRLTDVNPNWADVDLVVSTLGGQIAGSTNVTMKPGRTAIRVNGSVVQVYNRLLLDEEKDRIKRLLKQLTYSFGRKTEYDTIKAYGGSMSPEEEVSFTKDINTSNLITQYLSTILYWDRPQTGKTRTKNQFQVEAGFLKRGSGDNELSIPFNAESVENSMDTLLDGVYHQVANRLINDPNPYRVLDVDNQGELKYTTWNTYKEYLLSSKGRAGGETPIYTNIVERSADATISQLKNVYLMFSTESSDRPLSHEIKTSTVDIKSGMSLNGDYNLVYSSDKSGTQLSIDFTWTSPTNRKVTKTTIVQGTVSQETADKFAAGLLDLLADVNSSEQLYTAGDKDVTALGRIEWWKGQGNTLSLKKQSVIEISGTAPAPIITPPTVEPETPPVTDDSPPTPSVEDLLKKYNENMQESTDDDDYRVQLYDESAVYVREDEATVRNWFAHNLPQFGVSFVDNLIKGRYWGQFKGGAIWISRQAEQGTGFHEAFEAVWNSILSPVQQQSLIDEFKRRAGYQSLLDKTAQVWKGLTEDQLVKETLAEQFREYVINDGNLSLPKGRSKINTFFRQLWNFIKGLFSKADRLYTIDELFSKLSNRGFANSPLRNYDKAVANFKRIPNVSQDVSTQLIEGMAAQFFMKLFSKQENTDSLFSKQSNFKLINDILTEIRDQNSQNWDLDIIAKAGIEAGVFKSPPRSKEETRQMANNLTVEDLQKLQAKMENFRATNKYNYRDKLNIISRFKDSVLPIFYDYLRQFGFVIRANTVEEENVDEVTDVENRESEATDTLGIKESITIDTRNTATTTVKLLIASLLDSEYNTAGAVIQRQNLLGMPTVVDYDKTLSTLFNELQGIASVFRGGKRVDALDLMFEKLDNKFSESGRYNNGYLWIYDLKRKLKYINKAGDRLDVASLKEEDIRLRVAFTKSFSKSKNAPKKLIFGDGGNIYSLDPITSSNLYRIREAWANNAKASTQRANDYLKIDNNRIVINKQSAKMKALLASRSLSDKLTLLNGLGITFSSLSTEVINSKTFGDAALRISALIDDGSIVTFDDLFSKQIANGPISSLLSIELSHNADNLSLQYRNPSGQNEYSIVNPSDFSNTLNSLKQVSSFKDFILTNPQYGYIDANGNAKLKTYLQNSELLRLGGKLFDDNGNKKRDIEYQLISGIAQATEADGEITARLKRPDKVIQEMFYILNGTYYTIINSDKSSEFGLNFGDFVQMFDFTSASKVYTPETRRIYTNHLIDEVNSLIALANGIGSDIQYYSSNQKDKAGNWLLSHFRNIVKDSSSIKKLQEAIKNRTSEVFASDTRVQQEIENYLNDFVARQQQVLIDVGIVEKLVDGNYRTNGFSQEQLNTFKKQGLDLGVKSFGQVQFDNLSRYLFVNHQIAVREQHKLIYDHPAMYKDLPKRANGATSTKEAIVDSPDVLLWMDNNNPRLDGKKRASEQIPTFKVISYADVNTISLFYKDIAEGMYDSMIKDMPKDKAEDIIGAFFDNTGRIVKYNNKGLLKAYIELNEADAQAYILPDFYYDLLFLSSKWSAGQQRQFDYETAYERQRRSREELRSSDHPSYKPYTPEQIKQGLPDKDKKIVDAGSPGYVLPILKPQYFGPQVDSNHIHISFLKHSVQPKFYRFFEGTNFEHIYVNAQNNQVDVIGYESGEKVGNVLNDNGSFTSIYNSDGEINNSQLPPIQQMYQKYYGVQVEMAAKLKDEVIRGTQMTKDIMLNIFRDGKPIRPEYRQLISDYNNTIRKLTDLGMEELLKELGLQRTDDGSYVTFDLRKLVTTLRDEAAKRDLPSNIVEAFEASLQDSTTGLVYKFDSFSNRDKIDNILNSIVDSRIISQHMHGKAAVQAAVTLTEKLDNRRGVMFLNGQGIYEEVTDVSSLTPEQRKSVRLTSSDLKFYRRENGKIAAMEVYLPYWFKELYGKGTPDISTLDPRLLNVIGFRIPTQGMNSIDNIIVKGFLNPEEGDTIVVPSEIVGKSGSDFDIDKLNLYIPNYRIVDGKPVYIEPNDDNNKKSLQNRLIQQLSSILSLEENYRQLVTPNGAETLKALENEILSLQGVSKDKSIPFTELSEWAYMNETRERFLVGKQLVGIGAIHIPNHALAQVSDIFLTGLIGGKDIVIKFPHNERNGQLYLSAIVDKAGQWISELLSEALTGFVDAAKDPFVFNLNINPATAGTYFYLSRLGVPISSIAYFHTQPIIIDYIRNQQTNESLLNKINGNELTKREVTLLTMSDYVNKAFPGLVKDREGKATDLRTLFYTLDTESYEYGYYDGWYKPSQDAYRTAVREVETAINDVRATISNYSDNSLRSMIERGANNRLDSGQSRQQLAILSDFLDYQQQASALGDFVNGFSYDTARTKNIIENKLQQFKYDKVLRQNFIANPEAILEHTFLDKMKEGKEEVPKMFANYFVALHPNAAASFNKMYALINNDNVNMSDDVKVQMLNRYQNFFLNHLLHTIKIRANGNDSSINQFYNLLFGDDSFARRVKQLQSRYPENKLLQELFPIVSTDRSNTDNVKMFTTKLSTYEANSTIEAAVNLLEEAETDPGLKEFMNNLAIFAIIQSGVQQSPISYTKILPNELYAELVGTIFDKFTDTPFTTDPTIIYKQFFQNSYWNTAVVPSGNKGFVQDGILSVPNYYRIGGYDFLSRRSINKKADGSTYSRAEIDELKKNKAWDTLYTTTLYQKFHTDARKAYYRPVNKLGNRIFAIEAYVTDTKNMTKEQIALSGINGYIDESGFDDQVNKIIDPGNTGPRGGIVSKMERRNQENNSTLGDQSDTNKKTKDDLTCND